MKKIFLTGAVLLSALFPLATYAQSDLLSEKLNENFLTAIQPELLEKAANPETSVYDYMLICKRLAIYGDKTAISVLEPYLGDADKAHWARTSLEAMPFPEAVQALRNALGKVSDPLLQAGLIDSLGMREDAEAIPLLLPLLTNENATLADAAMFALARIANPSYADAMFAAKASRPFDTLLMYGEFLRRKGHADAAEAVFSHVADKATLDFYKEAAFFQILLRDSDLTRKKMAEYLVGQAEIPYRSALRAAQFLKSDAICGVLMEAYANVSDARKPAILAALGDQQNLRAQQTLVDAIGSEQEAIQAAALKALQASVHAAAFQDLVKTALSGDAALKTGVLIVVRQLPPEVDFQIEKLLQSTHPAEKQLAMEMAGVRKMTHMTDTIFAVAQKETGAMKLAAIRALGEIVQNPEPFAFLVETAITTQDAELRDAARASLQSACGTILNRDAAATILANGVNHVKNDDMRRFLFDMLRLLGGPVAVDTVSKAAFSDDPKLQDLATNVMGRWYDPDVAYSLLKLANTPNYPFANRVLKGYLRLARQFSMPSWRRAAMVRDALACPACTDAEKEIAGIILKQYGLDLSIPETDAQKALRNLCVELAIYGDPNDSSKQMDVTRKVRDLLLQADSLTLKPGAYNALFGSDPAPNTRKTLSLKFRLLDSGETKTLTVSEGANISLPKP
ncbi:MAG: HEAT repeat domain-containing protein [Planctomycetia bacterium]|nr:HEAT repeat domain-containing protein [Planctomycetia bacterium]